MCLVPEGAGLQVKPVLDQESKKTFHLSATEKRLVQGAEGLRIKKRDKNNKLREITEENWQEFEEDCENSNVRVLNSADKQRIILDALNDLRAPEEMDVPGCSDKKLYIGQAISKYTNRWLSIQYTIRTSQQFVLSCINCQNENSLFLRHSSSIGPGVRPRHPNSSFKQHRWAELAEAKMVQILWMASTPG